MNPDVVELARGRCRELRGHALMLQELAGGLPSNYHRDQQLIKKPLFAAVDDAHEWLSVLLRLVPALEVDAERAAAACTDELYAAHHACALACEGMPFRDAYRQVAQQLENGSFSPDRNTLTATHTGGVANPGLQQLEEGIERFRYWLAHTAARLKKYENVIWKGSS